MISLLTRIAGHLRGGRYVNEASVREGIVVPILRELGWNPSDPDHLKPEHHSDAGFADYVLFGRGRNVAVVIEVKAVGRALLGDRQLFRYCFELGAPLAILTDGRTWDFYFPSGQGSIEERRVYSLVIDERAPQESERIFERYLARDRIVDRSAIANVRDDFDKALSQREAVAILPESWAELVGEADDRLLELVQDKAEAKSGYRPEAGDVLGFLQAFRMPEAPMNRRAATSVTASTRTTEQPLPSTTATEPSERAITWRLFGKRGSSPFASKALVEILREIAASDPSKLPHLADMVRSPKRNHIARSPLEVVPERPDLARAEEISPGWYVGLNIANRDKAMILRAACDVYGLSMPGDLEVRFPNA